MHASYSGAFGSALATEFVRVVYELPAALGAELGQL